MVITGAANPRTHQKSRENQGCDHDNIREIIVSAVWMGNLKQNKGKK
jgi:hypothetical protein